MNVMFAHILAAGIVASAGIVSLLSPGVASIAHSAESFGCLKGIMRNNYHVFNGLIQGHKGPVYLWDVALHGNVGDGLLWLGAKNLIRWYGVNPDLICAQSQREWGPYTHRWARNDLAQFPYCPEAKEVAKAATTATSKHILVLWHAGGNFGDLYPWAQSYRVQFIKEIDSEVQALRLNGYPGTKMTIVQLPQSIFYTANTSKMAESNKKDLTNLTSVELHLFSRSQYSADVAKQMFGPDKPALSQVAADMAYMIGPQAHPYTPVVDMLLLLRMDQESALQKAAAEGILNAFFSQPQHRHLKWELTSWKVFDKVTQTRVGLPPDLADLRLQEAAQTLSRGRLVITNHLHGVVASELHHIPVFWFEKKSLYSKLGSTIGYAHSLSEKCTPEALLSFNVGENHDNEAGMLFDALQQAADYLHKAGLYKMKQI